MSPWTARVHTHEGQLAHEGIGHQLEGQSRELSLSSALRDASFVFFVVFMT